MRPRTSFSGIPMVFPIKFRGSHMFWVCAVNPPTTSSSRSRVSCQDEHDFKYPPIFPSFLYKQVRHQFTDIIFPDS